MRARSALLVLGLCVLLPAPEARTELPRVRSIVVDATAYNSVPEQTEGDPWLSASGHRLATALK